MKSIRRLLLVTALAFICNACVSVGTQSTIADGWVTRDEQLRQLIVDRTLYGRYSDGKRWIEHYEANGDSAYAGDGELCRGHWKISGGIACFSYANFANGDPNCFRVWKSGETLKFEPDSGPEYDVIVDKSVSGDPENLESKIDASCRR